MPSNDLAGLFAILGTVGTSINDLAAALSVLGSSILLLAAIFFPKIRLRDLDLFGNWSILGLMLGGLLQVCMYLSGIVPEKIGFILKLSPEMVNLLFGISLLLLCVRFLILGKYKKSKGKFQKERPARRA